MSCNNLTEFPFLLFFGWFFVIVFGFLIMSWRFDSVVCENEKASLHCH